jgi:hypothetical protein
VVTGFGDAVIVAAGAAGLAAKAFASGCFDGPHAAKNNSGRRIAIVGINRFIRSYAYGVSRTVSFLSSRVAKPFAERFPQKLTRSPPLKLWLSKFWQASSPVNELGNALPFIAPRQPRSVERYSDQSSGQHSEKFSCA